MAGRLLDMAVIRHEAIASNIANAETPGYRRVDVDPDFVRVLRTTQAKMAMPASELAASVVADQHARTVRPDGNSVEIENELLEMSRNTVEYDFLTDVVSSHIKHLRTAITGRNTS
ncbi:flagellar basal body rod protein FlgB [Termitidicoccus mucosus]